MESMTDPEHPVLSLTTTVGSLDQARQLASALVGQRLAACVQLDGGVESHYRWQGAVQAEPEVRLTIKSAPARLQDLQDYLARHHPYQLPQLLWHLEAASPAYADWVRQEVSAD